MGEATSGHPIEAPARRWLAPAVVVGIAAALRFSGLEAESLWFDEGHSLQTAQLSPRDAVASLAADVHPPLYFLLLGGWTRLFGESDLALRSLSALFGTLAVAALYFLGRRLGGPRVGLVAALLAAASPYHVRYAQEARPYALLLLLATLSTTAMLRLAERPGSAGRRTAFVLATAALLYTHAVAVFVVFALTVWWFAAARRSPGSLRAALVCGGATLVLFAPWLPTLWGQIRAVEADYWMPSPTARRVRRSLVEHAGGAFALATLAIAAVVGVASRPLRSPPGTRLLAALLYVVPVAAPLAASLVGSSIFVTRTSMVSSLGLFLLAALGIDGLAATRVPRLLGSERAGRAAGPAAALALLVAALAFGGRTLYLQYRTTFNADLRAAVDRVEARAQPGDVVYVGGRFERVVVLHYLGRSDLHVALPGALPPDSASSAWTLTTIHVAPTSRLREHLDDLGWTAGPTERLRRVELTRHERR